MALSFEIERPGQADGIREVNLAAFPTPEEADLVDALRGELDPWLSYVARDGERVVGHLLYTPVTLKPPPERPLRVLGLGPMAVLPQYQGRGIGSTLVDWSLSELSRGDVAAVVVLGHPEWYPRFGFQPAAYFGLKIALDAPANAFLAREFSGGCLSNLGGARVHYHSAFNGN